MSPSDKTSKHFRIGVAMFPNAQPLDFIGPLDILNSISPDRATTSGRDFSIQSVLLAATMDPVVLNGGMAVVPQMTYDEARKEHWDAVLVPGGRGARPWEDSNKPTRDFLVEVAPKCQYVLTVCTGSWLLSATGALKGQKATTNKAAYKSCVEHSQDSGVTWVPKARWVVSDKYWTSSGVTAGIDMAAAFLKHFIAAHVEPERVKDVADQLLGVLEVTGAEEGDDPWAAYYGLV